MSHIIWLIYYTWFIIYETPFKASVDESEEQENESRLLEAAEYGNIPLTRELIQKDNIQINCIGSLLWLIDNESFYKDRHVEINVDTHLSICKRKKSFISLSKKSF